MKTVRLSDIALIQSGGTPKRSNSLYWENGNIPWVKIGDIKSKYLKECEEFITVEGLKNSSAKIFNKGSILYTIFATLGEVAILDIDAATNQAIAGITVQDKRVNVEYLYYYLKSIKHDVNNLGRGVAQNNINLSILKNLSIPIRSDCEQIKIVNCLNFVTKIIEQKNRQLNLLDELVKSRFVELFGTYPANEKRWATGKVRDVILEAKYGSSRPAVDGGKYPYLRMNNITYDGELDLSDIKFINIPDKELPKCTVKRGDVLFNRTNSKELVGKTCVYNRDEMMVLAGFVIRIRVNDKVLPEFLSAFLNTDFSKQMLSNMCKNAIGQANINSQEMQNIGIYIPPIERQRKFVFMKNKIDKSRLLFKCQLLQYHNIEHIIRGRNYG